jgi:SynChlorMet cassette protein ScmC
MYPQFHPDTNENFVPPCDFLLTLADGTCLVLSSRDAAAAQTVAFLAEAAQLALAPAALTSDTQRLCAVSDGSALPEPTQPGAEVIVSLEVPAQRCPFRRRFDENGVLVIEPIVLTPFTEEQRLWMRLSRLSAAIGRETQSHGGVLLHSALAVRSPFPAVPGIGLEEEGAVLLAGRSGIGKSTVSRRLPPPWRSLCDDMALVVRRTTSAQDANQFWAHPWPTWSNFFGFEKCEDHRQWDVQRAVPLRGIFFLENGKEDCVCPIGPGEAACRLTLLAHDTTTYLMQGWPLEEIAAFNLQRFENLCVLVKTLPAFILNVKLHGKFWKKMDEVLCS